ncbi:hypothetical protein D3C73_1436120 [compost metagenome]
MNASAALQRIEILVDFIASVKSNSQLADRACMQHVQAALQAQHPGLEGWGDHLDVNAALLNIADQIRNGASAPKPDYGSVFDKSKRRFGACLLQFVVFHPFRSFRIVR